MKNTRVEISFILSVVFCAVILRGQEYANPNYEAANGQSNAANQNPDPQANSNNAQPDPAFQNSGPQGFGANSQPPGFQGPPQAPPFQNFPEMPVDTNPFPDGLISFNQPPPPQAPPLFYSSPTTPAQSSYPLQNIPVIPSNSPPPFQDASRVPSNTPPILQNSPKTTEEITPTTTEKPKTTEQLSSTPSSPISSTTSSSDDTSKSSTHDAGNRHSRSSQKNKTHKSPHITHYPHTVKKVICLFNSRHYEKQNFTPADIDPTLCTILNYEFAILNESTHCLEFQKLDKDMNFLEQARHLKKINPSLLILVCLGGWRDSTKKYSELAASPEKRKAFIEDVIPLLKTNNFDGLDISWQYPNAWQGAIGISHHDKPNFATFLEELSVEFNKEGLMLSVSVSAAEQEINAAYIVPRISKAVHHINVMVYDLHGAWESKTGHHAQYEKIPGESGPTADLNMKTAMDLWVSKGADKSKLILGLPTYAHTFTLTDENNNGLGAPTKGIGKPGNVTQSGGFLAYSEICTLLFDNPTARIRTDKHAGSFMNVGDQWMCFDSVSQCKKKLQYVFDEGLGGIMIKDLGMDDFKGLCYGIKFFITRTLKYLMDFLEQ